MKSFIFWMRKTESTLHPVEFAALAHLRFIFIHPFIDGNGRTARLLMNLILLQNGYPASVILNVDRKKYYRVLMEADRERYNNYFDFIGRSVERSLFIYLNALKSKDAREDNYGYISLADASKLCNYGIEYLSYLARTGRLQAIKIRRNWMTTREAIMDYGEKVKKNT
jgi:Fic family protein